MRSASTSPSSILPAATCYFSIPVNTTTAYDYSSHFSLETPSTTPVSEYSQSTCADPFNPLLALRPPPFGAMPTPVDSSRVLQLQTDAAHRPAAQSLQHTSSSSSNDSDSSMSSQHSSRISQSILCCCRCRRESTGRNGMVQFGTNLYYCNHCAKMTGYCAG